MSRAIIKYIFYAMYLPHSILTAFLVYLYDQNNSFLLKYMKLYTVKKIKFLSFLSVSANLRNVWSDFDGAFTGQ